MNSPISELAKTGISIPRLRDSSLEDVLIALTQYGSPMVTQFDDGGWYCKVTMRVASQGVSFEVKSGFKEPTPKEAAVVCMERIVETLSKYEGMQS